MLRVAYLVPGLHPSSGWRSHARGFIQAISQFVEPVLFVSAEDHPLASALFPHHQCITLPTIQQAFLRTRGGIAGFIASQRAIRGQAPVKVDLVHSLEAYPTGLIGHWLACRLERPHVLTGHGTYAILPHRFLLDRFAYKRVLKGAAAMYTVSRGTAHLVQEYFPDAVANLRVQAILNGNDYHKIVPRQEVLLRKPSEIPTLLSVGPIKPRKGQHISLRAFARVKKIIPSARYWIVGDINEQQKYYQELVQFIAENQIKDVEFLGRVSQERLKQCYQQAAVFVLTPQVVKLRFEGFGLVYLEAGAFGLPVVGTRAGGVPDAIQNGKTGFLVEPDDIDGVAKAIERLLTEPELRRHMGLANRDWAETLTWERNAQEQYQDYQHVIRHAR
jgi:glycosyltransferase involved in cell wall biosynthesis